jgi:hypothetical protein
MTAERDPLAELTARLGAGEVVHAPPSWGAALRAEPAGSLVVGVRFVRFDAPDAPDGTAARASR